MTEDVGKTLSISTYFSTPQPPNNTHPFSTASVNSLFNSLFNTLQPTPSFFQHPLFQRPTLFSTPSNQHLSHSTNSSCNLDAQSLLSALDGKRREVIIFFFSFYFMSNQHIFARLSVQKNAADILALPAGQRRGLFPISILFKTPSLSTSSLTNTHATHLTVVSTPFNQLSLSAKIVSIRVLKHRKEVLLTSSKKE